MNKSMVFILLFVLCFFNYSIAQKTKNEMLGPNYFEDIAPIISKHCLSCHQNSESGPFSLETYNKVFSKAKMIEKVVKNKIMPPWKADTSYRHFENENVLSNEEINTISKWVKAGALKGKKIINENNNEINNREPDAVIKLSSKYIVKANKKESTAWIKIPYEIDFEKSSINIEKIEFVLENKKIVHHVNYEFIRIPSALDNNTPPYFIDGDSLKKSKISVGDYLKIPIFQSYFKGTWLPGFTGFEFKNNIGLTIPRKGIVLVNSIHFYPTPINDSVGFQINLYYNKNHVDRISKTWLIEPNIYNSNFDLPNKISADSVKKYTVRHKIEENLSLIYVKPHMHHLGEKFEAKAIYPSGDTIPLIKINEWDVNWQMMYEYNPYIKLPLGTMIEINAVFNNTLKNFKNPNLPPKDVFLKNEMSLDDEMMQLLLVTTPYSIGDENKKYKKN